MTAVDKVLALAEAEVGYLEKASNYDLDSKTGNAGTANYTKYGRDMDKVADWYNGRKNGYEWCGVFVDWIFYTAFGTDVARKMLYRPAKSLSAGCRYAANYYKAKGRFDGTPKVGDQIFFGDASKDTWSHTGIVVGIDASYVYTIEGNTSGGSTVIANGGGVCKKKYKRGYSRILGYGHPDYSIVKMEDDDMTKAEVEQIVNEAVDAAMKKLRAELQTALGQIGVQYADLIARINARTDAAGVRSILEGEGSKPSGWAVDELAAAMAHGITDGTRPQGYATREEVAAMVNRALMHSFKA